MTYFIAAVKARGMKLKDLAESLGLSQSALSKRVHGKTEFSLCEAEAASKILGITLDTFSALLRGGITNAQQKEPPCVGAQGGAEKPQKGNEMKITMFKNGCTESVMELTPAEFMELVQMNQRQQLDAIMAQFLGGLMNGGDGYV